MSLSRSSLLLLGSLLAACSGGGGGGGGGGPAVIPGSSSFETLPGLLAAAGGPASARVDWKAPGPGFELALFRSTSQSTVYDAAPVATGMPGTSLVMTGLTNGVPLYFGLGIRHAGQTQYAETGLRISALPNNPIYVDSTANPTGADGTSPGTAFPNPTNGVLTAFLAGGGTVWVRDGNYDVSALPMFAGVHVYGGFSPAFDLATRDPGNTATVWNVPAGRIGVDIQGEEPAAVLDGIQVRGNGTGLVGIDVADTSIELRSVSVTQFTDRGIRLRNSLLTDCFDIRMTHVVSSENGADGLSAFGAFDFFIDGSRFESNVQEGVDLDDLLALENEQATLQVSGSLFFGNGTEGLDADLAAPLPPGPGGGTFRIDIRGCYFEQNGQDGALIDFDFELVTGWFASVEIRECFARGNSGHGIHLDLDAPGNALLHRIRSSANGGDGIQISSESNPGLVVISASATTGNLGAGIRATFGNRVVVATQCVVTGNAGGGIQSDTVEAAASSTVSYLQSTPRAGTRSIACVDVDDPMIAVFKNAAEQFARIDSVSGAVLTLASPATFPSMASLEVADDGTAQVATSVSGNTVTLPMAPDPLRTPGVLFAFAPGAPVDEDYMLVVGSPAEGTGLAAPGAPSVDAGLWGTPSPAAPGQGDEVPRDLFFVLSTSPPLSTPLGQLQSLDVVFSADLDAASVVIDQVRAVRADMTEIPITFQTLGGTLTIDPPGAGWGAQDFVIELHRGIRNTTGDSLDTPLALPISPL